MKPNKTHRAKPATGQSVATRPAAAYVLRLFVAGATDRSRLAVLRVRRMCAAEMNDSGTLEVIDIYQQPALARLHQIVVTPTLLREHPRPVRRFIGSLENLTGLFPEPDPPTTDRIAR